MRRLSTFTGKKGLDQPAFLIASSKDILSPPFFLFYHFYLSFDFLQGVIWISFPLRETFFLSQWFLVFIFLEVIGGLFFYS